MKTKMKPYVFLTVLSLLAIWFFVTRFAPFATNGDWSTQHSVIPEQFRQQFYETGQLFPEFTANLGGGQNIYHYSYYGLFNPVLLPSYLLPFVKMSDYLMAACIVCLVASVLLMYYWLGTHGFSGQVRLAAAILFLLAAPMIYHSHRQIMFVDYMPFLCLAFIGVDRYWKTRKPALYVGGVFLMIMTSFYFSIAGLFALCLYGFGRCEQEQNKSRVFGFILPTAAAVCMAGILLVPTAYALSARSGVSQKFSLASLLLPDLSIERFAYSGYGIGLTAAALAVPVLGLACKKLTVRFLSGGCLAVILIPFFSWILNGGLYARGKSLIPFLPVLCYLTAVCLEGIRQKAVSDRMCLTGYLAAAAFCAGSFYFCGNAKLTWQYKAVFAELLLLAVFFLLYRKIKLCLLLAVPSVLCLVFAGILLNQQHVLDADFYREITDRSWGDKISAVLQEEPGLFRLEQNGSYDENKANINRTWDTRQWSVSSYSSSYPESYKRFRETVFQTEQPSRNCLMQTVSQNPLFQKFMGIKYLVSRDFGQPEGKQFSVLRQEHTAPIIYATDQVIAEDTYRQMAFPYNQTTLMQYAVAGDGRQTEEGEITASLPAVRQTDIRIPKSDAVSQTGNGYDIQTKATAASPLFITEREKQTGQEQIFFLQFDVKNHKKSRDVIIEIAGIRNNLSAEDHVYYTGNTTFTCVVKLEKQQNQVDVLFHSGSYSITNIRGFLTDASLLQQDSLYQSQFLPDRASTKGNRICGEITAKSNGYLITSIPFDSGFEIRIDGRRMETEPVNTAFLGTKIPAGSHRVEITYHAPGAVLGKTVSALGIVLWAFAEALARKKPKEKCTLVPSDAIGLREYI